MPIVQYTVSAYMVACMPKYKPIYYRSAIRSLCTALCSYSVVALQDCTKPLKIESDASKTTVSSEFTQ